MDGGLVQFQLQPGQCRLGRADTCDCVIPDPSVSDAHGELSIGPESIVIRDLGSTNGTFLEGQSVQESELRIGQQFGLGGVECQLDPDPPAQMESPSVPARASLPSRPLASSRPPAPVLNVDQCSFFELLQGAFAYPFTPGGLGLLAVGAVLFSLVEGSYYFLRYAMMMGLVAMLILTVCSVGYLFSFMQGIILATINNEDRVPGWPEISNLFDDLVRPFFRFVFLVIACLGPGGFLMVWASPTLGMPVLLLGAYCMPMCLLTVAVADGLSGLNPVIVFSSIAKVPGAYFMVCVLFVVVLGIRSGSSYLLGQFHIPIVTTLVFNFITLSGWAITMRTLGLFYRKYKTRLAWFQ